VNPAWSSGAGVTLATSGATFLTGPGWDDWSGQLFVSTLKERDVRRFAVTCDGASVHQETLFDGAWGRLRAAVSGPGGFLYVTTSNGSGDRVIRVAASSWTVHRLAGTNRYATAAATSRNQFPSGATDVMVATGANYPDALAGSAAAGRLGMPILLTQQNGVPCETRAELDRLNPQRIWVLGSGGVISEAVKNDMAQYAAPGQTFRLAGSDRYSTAAAISAQFNPSGGVPAAFVATGQGFADALAGGPAAAVFGGPLLLVLPNGIPQATRDELARVAPQRIFVLGGPGAVSESVAMDLQNYTSGPVVRLWGHDRYATAAAVSSSFWPSGPPAAFVATGLDFPDALAGSAAAGRNRVPLLLVNRTAVPPATHAELQRLRPGHIYVLGGESVVARAVQHQMDTYTPQ
jgi:putative cell wall-binding protein